MQIFNQKAVFHAGKLAALAALYHQMPNMEDIFDHCRKNIKDHLFTSLGEPSMKKVLDENVASFGKTFKVTEETDPQYQDCELTGSIHATQYTIDINPAPGKKCNPKSI